MLTIIIMLKLDCKESWAPKNCWFFPPSYAIFTVVMILETEKKFFSISLWNCCFWPVVLEKILESPLDCKEIKPVNPKGNQSWIFIGRTDAEAETTVLWPPDVKNWLIGKDPDTGKDWRQEEKGMTEGETVGWHHWLNGHEFEHTQGDSEGQGSLACFSV